MRREQALVACGGRHRLTRVERLVKWLSTIVGARVAGRVGWSYADPHAVLLDDEENLKTHRRVGSIERGSRSALVTFENTPTATPSGVQLAVRKESL